MIEGVILIVGISALVTFFLACQKNLDVTWLVLAALIAPFAALAALAYIPARVHAVERGPRRRGPR